MPQCEGRPGVECPDGKNDRTVHLSQGDLMLCEACEHARFPEIAAAKRTKTGRGRKEIIATPVPTSGCHSAAPVGHHVSNTVMTPDTAAETAGPKDGTGMRQIVINELITYTAYYRNRANGDALRRVILTCYTPHDIHEAKELIADRFRSKIDGNPLLMDRRGSTTRPAQEAELDDILGLLDLLDEQRLLHDVQFVAAELDRLPKFGPEELNVCAVVDRQQKSDAVVSRLSNEVEQLKQALHTDSPPFAAGQEVFTSAMVEIQKRIDAFHSSVNSRIDHLNSVCTQLNISVNANAINATNNTVHDETDRSLNMIVFGVAESREVSLWKSKVDDILKFVVGREVEISDAFRLGKFNSDKTRPILVKLRSVWDKRLILKTSWKLKSYSERIFVGPDEPLEMRRRRTLERINYRAVRDGKSVTVNDDVLYIDGVATFSLRDGFLHNQDA